MKREKELAERRKNEPQLEVTQDHLVRKLFSRFRKGDRVSTGSSLQTDTSSVKDIEKGDSARASDSENEASLSQDLVKSIVKVSSSTKVSTEKDDAFGPPPKPAPVALKPKIGKWGALMGAGGGGGGGSSTPPQSTVKPTATTSSLSIDSGDETKVQAIVEPIPGSALAPAASSSEAQPISKLGKIKQATSGNKIFPKQTKQPLVSTSGRQETIDELTETASVGSPAKDMLVGSGHPAPSATALLSSTTSVEYQQIISNMMDFKVDVKLEIQRLNQKMNKLEDLLGDISSKLNQTLNGPGMVGMSSTTSQYSHRLLSPTSPMHSDTGGGTGRDERDTSPASGGEDQDGKKSGRHKSGDRHHHHKHRDRDKKHHRDRDKTPDTLSPESRLTSSDVGGGGTSRSSKGGDKRGARSKERPRTSSSSGGPGTSGGARTSESTVQQMLEDEIQEQQGAGGSSSKTSSAGSKEPLPPKAVIIPTGKGKGSSEFL